MLYIMDTHICQMVIGRNASVGARVAQASQMADTVATTIISFDESVSGWLPLCHDGKRLDKRAGAYVKLSETLAFYRTQLVLPFSADAAALLAQLNKRYQHIGINDLSIAAIALTLNGTVVTQNWRDFGRIPNLPIEDWSV